jgi:hypothetical protein
VGGGGCALDGKPSLLGNSWSSEVRGILTYSSSIIWLCICGETDNEDSNNGDLQYTVFNATCVCLMYLYMNQTYSRSGLITCGPWNCHTAHSDVGKYHIMCPLHQNIKFCEISQDIFNFQEYNFNANDQDIYILNIRIKTIFLNWIIVKFSLIAINNYLNIILL